MPDGNRQLSGGNKDSSGEIMNRATIIVLASGIIFGVGIPILSIYLYEIGAVTHWVQAFMMIGSISIYGVMRYVLRKRAKSAE